MRPYLLSLAVGLLAGAIYGLVNVRSPAPPVIALVGLLGILLGEQAASAVKRLMSNQALTMTWIRNECERNVLGTKPPAPSRASQARDEQTRDCV